MYVCARSGEKNIIKLRKSQIQLFFSPCTRQIGVICIKYISQHVMNQIMPRFIHKQFQNEPTIDSGVAKHQGDQRVYR
jgi:hypothetical protein